ncbi:hypothetical protein AVEN_182048-1 [Araneus ventricosus]|uniref:Uncharacterized protein n=1 Tax=Araneus ventricosus TaxID=182803 RepID=A0A4Y2M8C4_ARAVE|nr:hypothetical protein AVEN_182048-1 [Araneus ventricosus]
MRVKHYETTSIQAECPQRSTQHIIENAPTPPKTTSKRRHNNNAPIKKHYIYRNIKRTPGLQASGSFQNLRTAVLFSHYVNEGSSPKNMKRL